MLIALREQGQAIASWVILVNSSPIRHTERFGHPFTVKGDAIQLAPTQAAYGFLQTFMIITVDKGASYLYKDQSLVVFVCTHEGRVNP